MDIPPKNNIANESPSPQSPGKVVAITGAGSGIEAPALLRMLAVENW